MKNDNITRTGTLELRALENNEESRTVFGYAVVFDTPS